jgi:thiaminase (transcriptional activator TenA)
MSSEGSICDEMRAASSDIWDGLHAHPFLRELAAGTLALDRFRFFLEQDNFYLVEYARCLAMGAAKSRDDTELRYFTVDLDQVLATELPSNRALLARVIDLGAADRGGAVTMAPANVAYTSYLQALALRGGPLEIMAALLPCAWSYLEIAQRLAAGGTSTHEVYADWIGYFTLPANVEMVASMRRDFDRLAAQRGLGTATRAELGGIFATSSRLERGFWEMAYTLERWPDLELDRANVAGPAVP